MDVAATLSAVGEDKLRPIACGSTWRRLFAKVWSILYTPGYASLFDENGQYGVGSSNGVEKMAAGVALMHEVWWTIAVDLKNAFNSITRQAILAGLTKHCPQLVPYFVRVYCSSPAALIFRMDNGSIRILDSNTGSQQGDGLGSFFYCIGSLTVMDEFRQRHSAAGSDKWFCSYIDDGHLQFHQLNKDSLDTFQSLLDMFQPLGLVANITKTHVLPPHYHS
jgi:hypothetical protein